MWLQRAAERQMHAWAPGTIANYTSSIRKYLRFCFDMGMTPIQPTYKNTCAYIEFLVHTTPSPKTVSNHISHLRTYLRKAQASTHEVDNHRVKWALIAVSKDSSYIPRIKLAFPVHLLQRMVKLLPDTNQGKITKTAVLILYYAALRQSEVMPYSSASYNPKRHLSRNDVTIMGQSVQIRIKHAKNLQTVYQQKTVILHSAPDPGLCVVNALREQYAITPTNHPDDPCLMFNHNRRPVTVEFVRRNWANHLISQGINVAPLSLHSLRKAAATAAHNEGCPEIDIQTYGGWRSNAYRAYISPSQHNVNHAITRALNQ